ncbi:hypothetical protein FB550_11831 [Neobacillus bataviensis]|uniref:Uncharacterized protein n=1 Tax=Neobacillus bataviensis TaxID=220685 RepID=A0A561CN04_9BACI|nr:hypothetical protein [Neobacillus bataviensis]TWD92400.1 hypothetical protein FB550_11831 [Neobacillus bataviensis]
MLRKFFSMLVTKQPFNEERYDIEEEMEDEYYMDTDDPSRL